MHSPRGPITSAGVGLLALPLLQVRAPAQPQLEIASSVALSQLYDDNLFSTPGKQEADHIWRLSPRLGVGRRSSRLRLRAHYGLDSEVFRSHPELNAVAAGQRAALDVEWRMSPLLELAATAGYASAQTPGELNALTGVQAGRLPASELSTTESLSRRLGARTRVTLAHHFMRQEVATYPDSDTHTVRVAMEHRLRVGDVGRLAYSVRRYAFGPDPIVSHVVTLGWSGKLSSVVHVELDAGPSVTGHTIGADVTAALRRRFRFGDAGLAYLHTQTTVLGEPGPVTVEGLSATFNRRLGSLRVGVGSSFFSLHGRSESTIRLGAEVSWRLTQRMTLTASHQFALQQGGAGLARGSDAEIAHHRVLVGLAATSGGP